MKGAFPDTLQHRHRCRWPCFGSSIGIFLCQTGWVLAFLKQEVTDSITVASVMPTIFHFKSVVDIYREFVKYVSATVATACLRALKCKRTRRLMQPEPSRSQSHAMSITLRTRISHRLTRLPTGRVELPIGRSRIGKVPFEQPAQRLEGASLTAALQGALRGPRSTQPQLARPLDACLSVIHRFFKVPATSGTILERTKK